MEGIRRGSAANAAALAPTKSANAMMAWIEEWSRLDAARSGAHQTLSANAYRLSANATGAWRGQEGHQFGDIARLAALG